MTQPHPTCPDSALAPVPVALFLPPGRFCATPTPDDAGLSPHLAGQLVVTYTRAGDRICDRDGSTVLGRVATALHRHVVTGADRADGHPEMPAALIYAQIPRPGRPGVDLCVLSAWVRQQRLALTAGGFLVTAVSADSPDGSYVDRATTVITAARSTGLVYHQHLVAVRDPVPENELIDTPETVDACVPAPAARPYTSMHSDLFVFALIGGGHNA